LSFFRIANVATITDASGLDAFVAPVAVRAAFDWWTIRPCACGDPKPWRALCAFECDICGFVRVRGGSLASGAITRGTAGNFRRVGRFVSHFVGLGTVEHDARAHAAGAQDAPAVPTA
jgi:hypothetical protein